MKTISKSLRWMAAYAAVFFALGTAFGETVAEGSWTDKGYAVAGKWSIEKEGGKMVVKLDENFKTSSGPDLKIFLSPQTVASLKGGNATKGAVLVAPLKSTKGAATYAIPAGTDLSKFKAIVIHCEKFSKLWSAGALPGS
ncbi:hypothetical protein BH23VER1_BH23VER1_11480 [soil metagenome]